MEKKIFIQTGTGVDLHGQNVNQASERAINNAIQSNSMPGIQDALPNQDLNNMKVNVKLGIPRDLEDLDEERIKKLIPYGDVSVEKLDGGLASTNGIYLSEQEDKNDLMYIVNAVVEVGY
ncbi:Lin0512 family protein [Oceanobacillus sp. FSL W7-1293]|uniref:Lin0512 family protein n=1 Tax=unclassified Oceanobacillus TaxID=2630292 RepID=UPI0030D195AE